MKSFLKTTFPIILVILLIASYYFYQNTFLRAKNIKEIVKKSSNFECDISTVPMIHVEEALGNYHTVSYSYPSCFKPSTTPGLAFGYKRVFERADSTKSYELPYLSFETGFIVPLERISGSIHEEHPKTIIKKTEFMGSPAEYLMYKDPTCLKVPENCSPYSRDIILFRFEKEFDVERAVNSKSDFAIAVYVSPKDTKNYLPLLEKIVSTLVIK